jgi:hypothetical protein
MSCTYPRRSIGGLSSGPKKSTAQTFNLRRESWANTSFQLECKPPTVWGMLRRTVPIPSGSRRGRVSKPTKDFWDKLDIFGKVFIVLVAAAATVVVANIGGQVQKVVTTQSTGKDFVQIALGILEKKDLTEEMQKNPGLRKWAVGLLNHYSDVALDDDTAKKVDRW